MPTHYSSVSRNGWTGPEANSTPHFFMLPSMLPSIRRLGVPPVWRDSYTSARSLPIATSSIKIRLSRRIKPTARCATKIECDLSGKYLHVKFRQAQTDASLAVGALFACRSRRPDARKEVRPTGDVQDDDATSGWGCVTRCKQLV